MAADADCPKGRENSQSRGERGRDKREEKGKRRGVDERYCEKTVVTPMRPRSHLSPRQAGYVADFAVTAGCPVIAAHQGRCVGGG